MNLSHAELTRMEGTAGSPRDDFVRSAHVQNRPLLRTADAAVACDSE